MTTPRFIYNLRPATFNDVVVEALSPFGYLLAPNNATASLRALARSVRSTRRRFLVDNGQFSSIGVVRALFAAEASELTRRVADIEARLGRSVRKRDVPPDLRTAFVALANNVRQHVKERAAADASARDAQLELDPTHLIGVEDITVATWLGLNLEPAYTARARTDYRRYNQAVARRAIRELEALPRSLAHGYYAVASAMSYDTAHDAGRVFAAAGIDAVAMGFGAYMADNNSTDYMTIRGREIPFPGRLPTRYTRTAAVTKGFFDGYRAERRRAPKAFHFLGLGAPIMFPIVTLCAQATDALTFDAMSPILDATEGGTLYTEKPAYLKIRTRKVAHRLASDRGRTWNCPCPFCQAIGIAHPFDYALGHRWFERERGRDVVVDDLRPGGALFAAYPLLSEPSPGPLRNAVDAARIGHNHWIVERVMTSLRRAAREKRLATRVAAAVDTYAPQTTPPFAAAVGFGLRIAQGVF